MRNKKKSMFLVFALLFITGANAQQVASTQGVDEYNTLKTVAALVLLIVALAVLYYSSKRKPVPTGGQPVVQADHPASDSSVPDEVVAAIVMMMKDMQDCVHDEDNTVLTIQKMKINYSPWNSKIFGLRQIPAKK
jgi:hypothetical protein